MNAEQFKSLAGRVLAFLGGMLGTWGATKGGFLVQNWELISGVILTVGTAVWSLYINRDNGVIQAAANLPEVKKVVVTTEKLAAATTAEGAKVTTS